MTRWIYNKYNSGGPQLSALHPMKSNTFQIVRIVWVFLLLTSLTGCAENPNMATKVIPTTAGISTVSPSPTKQISKTPTPSPSPTISFTPTLYKSPTITASSTSTPLPSLTPLPTSSNPQAIIDQYYEANGNCKLPCWWGITPGKTTLEELRQFSRYLSIGNESNLDSDQEYEVVISSPGHRYEQPGFTLFKIKNDIVQEITITADIAAWGGFISSNMLHEYGQPDAIYYSPANPHIFLFYQQKRILAVYQLGHVKIGDGTTLCFMGFTYIITWAEEEIWSKDRIRAEFPINTLESHLETTDPQFQEYLARLQAGDDYLCSKLY